MELRIITPEQVTRHDHVCRIVAEAANGVFGILPRHMDHVTQLAAGVLVFETEAGEEQFVGVNAGTLVKAGPTVMVAVRDVIASDDLGHLRERVEAEFRRHTDEEREARSALARLEAHMIRRFRELQGVNQ
ncbi:F0F1 ATP synthase subunit epsilon [Marivita sp.]|uniref:F0F1 ATP synthase subunit epsilon n=1 Tax=Marivita sp. TaxID=2003365 RepID=UPI0025BC324B|nr:F0F1 ATP synthase subunit epsilon [Marivita sp.]